MWLYLNLNKFVCARTIWWLLISLLLIGQPRKKLSLGIPFWAASFVLSLGLRETPFVVEQLIEPFFL